MAYETIKYEVAEQILTITLNRPDKLNAFTGRMMHEMIDVFTKVNSDDEVRAVIVTGAGRAFCAGADLGDLRRRQAEKAFSLGDELRDHFNPLILQLRKLEKPVIGAVNGLAVQACSRASERPMKRGMK